MPANAKVFIHYGPYEACGGIEHRLHRLDGLIDVLQSAGHTVELMELPYRDTLELKVNGETVFSCSETQLDFGGDGQLDPLCKEALRKVNNAY